MATSARHLTCIGVSLMLFSTQGRLTPRPLADIGTISVPSVLKGESTQYNEESNSRLTFKFSSTYFWASMFTVPAYKQLLIVSVMAPDATDAEYAAPPRAFNTRYESRKQRKTIPLGSGLLTIAEGIYEVGERDEPAIEYMYVDKRKRLQLAWHAVKKEIDLERSLSVLTQIAASFKIARDPLATFAAMRAAPGNEAAERERRVATAKAMLLREGYPVLTPGEPVLRNGVYLEWMEEPERRYQLLLPLGRVRKPLSGGLAARPRPAAKSAEDPRDQGIARYMGWREQQDGEWLFSNQENAYLPMVGIGRALDAQQQDPDFVYFYYAVTVRVEEEEETDTLLSSLRWFFDEIPTIQQRWRAGALVTTGSPEPF